MSRCRRLALVRTVVTLLVVAGFCLAPFAGVTPRVSADTAVSGGQFADTVWTLAQSPYHVTGNVTLFPGYTLAIQPGVSVRFDDNTSLIVRGSLVAQGLMTAALAIVIASVLFVIVEFDRPFTGDIRVEPTTFEQLLVSMQGEGIPASTSPAHS